MRRFFYANQGLVFYMVKRQEPPVYRYFILNKPHGVISQFTDQVRKNKKLRWVYNFPKQVYPIGRLDKDSEGLLILTNDRTLHQTLLNPDNQHEREYWVQVHGEPTQDAMETLKSGVFISTEKQNHFARAKDASILTPQPVIPDRDPPISPRGPYPVPWISLTLTEGKYRQVRKMTAKAGLPTLRLFRRRIANLSIDLNFLNFGEVKEVSHEFLREKLFTHNQGFPKQEDQ